MIYGIGTDIVEVVRIEESLSRFGDAFAQRILNNTEWQEYEASRVKARFLAKRFAAKEACSKALGTGFRDQVFMKDMGVVNLPSGKPTLKLTNGALRRLEEITPAGMVAQIDLTITDDFPQAQAIVIISAYPPAGEVA